MKRLILPLLITLPLAGCFNSDDSPSVKMIELDEAIEQNYTVTEGKVFSIKIPKIKGELILAQSEIKGVSINADSDGWVISFDAPWVSVETDNANNSVPYSLTLKQRVNEFKEIKKTIYFNVMDISSPPKLDFSPARVKPSSVSVQFKGKAVEKNKLIVKTRTEHGFILPFKVIELDADDISLAVSVTQNQSALSGAKIEQVGDEDFNLIVPVDVSNNLKDVDVTLIVSDSDGMNTYTISHRRLITPHVKMNFKGAITVSPSKPVNVYFDKNFVGADYHFETRFFEKDMSLLSSNVWLDVKLAPESDSVEFSVKGITSNWEGVVEITVVRDGERGVHHYPIRVQK
tara:strand:- start:7760 stop:8794 length:1035 start_codon:yes stop_codon:yes gene_type:complete